MRGHIGNNAARLHKHRGIRIRHINAPAIRQFIVHRWNQARRRLIIICVILHLFSHFLFSKILSVLHSSLSAIRLLRIVLRKVFLILQKQITVTCFLLLRVPRSCAKCNFYSLFFTESGRYSLLFFRIRAQKEAAAHFFAQTASLG